MKPFLVRSRVSLLSLGVLLSACGSGGGGAQGEGASGASEPDGSTASAGLEGFDVPPPPEGYTRLVAPVMKDLPPGSDISQCQYVMAPADRDLDILDMGGFQSIGGHHSVAYATTAEVAVGVSRDCTDADNLVGGFLGGVGGEGGGGADLPEGVVFRLPKGNAIMLNTHFLNTTSETVDGHTVIDILFADADDSRKVASLFTNGTLGFEVPAGAEYDVVAECTPPDDMEIVLFANHMHDYGAKVSTELVRADTGDVEMLHDDPAWSAEMQFNGAFSRWTLEDPLVVHAGDTFRTSCTWQNGTDEPLTFPREMCFGLAFFISDGSTSPVCLDGRWMDRFEAN